MPHGLLAWLLFLICYLLAGVATLAWSVISLLYWESKVQSCGAALGRGKGWSWLLGFLQLIVLLLLLSKAEGRPLVTLLTLASLAYTAWGWNCAMTAIFLDLGRRVERAGGRTGPLNPMRYTLMGGTLLLLAFSFPVLGPIGLIFLSIRCVGIAWMAPAKSVQNSDVEPPPAAE